MHEFAPTDARIPYNYNKQQEPNFMSTWLASSFLSKDRIVAKPGFNRWLVAPAALAVHLCIGQVYAFSVFNLPLTKVLGVTQALPEDWKLTTLGWIFSLAIVFLGLSAAKRMRCSPNDP